MCRFECSVPGESYDETGLCCIEKVTGRGITHAGRLDRYVLRGLIEEIEGCGLHQFGRTAGRVDEHSGSLEALYKRSLAACFFYYPIVLPEM